MDRVDLSMESLAFQSPMLCYARLGILAMANSVWTWMALLLTALLSLWRLRGVNGFCVGFTWWGKHAQVKVMLQSSSTSSSSSTHKTMRMEDNSCVNCLNMSKNLYMDDLDLLAYRKQTLNDRGICRRSKSKSSSTFDSLTLCNSISSDCLDVSQRNSTCFLETEMIFIYEKSSYSLFAPKYAPSCIGGNSFAEQQFESPTSKKCDCSADSFGNRIQKHKQCGISVESGRMQCGMKNCCKFLSSKLISEEEGGDICKGSGFVFKDNDKEEEGFYLLDPHIGLSRCQRLVSFESQFGWDKFLFFRLGFAWDCCTEKVRLNSDIFSEHYVQDNVVEVWDGPRRSLMNLLCIPEGFASSLDISRNRGLLSVCTIDNSVQLWNLQMAHNQVVVKNGTSVGTHMQDSHESLLSGVVTRDEKTSVFVWDPRIFAKPLNSLLGNQPSFHSPKIIDKKIHVLDGFSNKLFDLRMLGASPIEESPIQHKNLSSSSPREDTARPTQNAYLEDFLFNEDDDVCEGIVHGFLDSGKSCRSSLFELCMGAISLLTAQSANQHG